MNTPPQTTRAKLRGEFITAAQEAGRDFTVDWVHLKLNDQARRQVLCKDPFRSSTAGSSALLPRCSYRASRRIRRGRRPIAARVAFAARLLEGMPVVRVGIAPLRIGAVRVFLKVAV